MGGDEVRGAARETGVDAGDARALTFFSLERTGYSLLNSRRRRLYETSSCLEMSRALCRAQLGAEAGENRELGAGLASLARALVEKLNTRSGSLTSCEGLNIAPLSSVPRGHPDST